MEYRDTCSLRALRWGLIILLAIGLVLLGLGYAQPVSAQQGGVPRFDSAPCSTLNLQTPAALTQGLNMQCGWLTVPEEHANPGGPTIRLGVVVIKSKSANPAPDPLVMMQGGPGGSTIDIYTQLIPFDPRLNNLNRDIVLFDQRGTQYSQPSLFCQAYYDEIIRQLNENISKAESNQRAQTALKTCYDQFSQNGVNLSAFDTVENAADVESLRQALGYQKINLYGVSYGTEVVLQVLRDSPQALRSAIIDSVLPPQINFIQNAPQVDQRALESVFTDCAADPKCNNAYPNLKQVFYQQVDRLNANKAHIQVTDSKTSTTYPALLDGDSVISAITQMLYMTDMVPLVPRIIYQVKDGDYRFIENILGLVVFDKSISFGMYFSVVCSEDTNINPQQVDLSGMPPQLQNYEKDTVQQVANTCAFWKVQPVNATARQPVNSDIPTLVLAGHYDPATPPAYAQEAAKTLTNSYFFLFPIGGHGQLTSGECQDSIFLQFLSNPGQKPDGACVTQQKIVFSTPGSLVRLPVLLSLLNLQGPITWQLGLYALALLFLLTALGVYPVVWLVRLLRRPAARPVAVTPIPGAGPYAPVEMPVTPVVPARRPLLYRLSPWFAALAGPMLLGIMVAIYVIGFQLAFKNDSRVLLGLPGEYRPLFILPVAAAVLMLLMLAGALIAWMRRAGSAWGRVYLTLLSLAALVCVVLLGIWGILTGLFAG